MSNLNTIENIFFFRVTFYKINMGIHFLSQKKKQCVREFSRQRFLKSRRRIFGSTHFSQLQLTLVQFDIFFSKLDETCAFRKSGLSATLAERIFSWFSRSAWQSASAKCTPHARCDRKTTTTTTMMTTTTHRRYAQGWEFVA